MIKSVDKLDSKILIESSEGTFQRDFEEKIIDFHVFDETRVVIVLNAKSRYSNRNVFCVNERADILWQVEEPTSFMADKNIASSFTGIYITENEAVQLVNWNSHVFSLDIETGKLSKPTFTK